MSKNTEE